MWFRNSIVPCRVFLDGIIFQLGQAGGKSQVKPGCSRSMALRVTKMGERVIERKLLLPFCDNA